ncbi:MAG: hypothetical protein JW384_03193 [Nitrosomonadaceae bacterium]|nr:hypothetical protein [Nitrosomonadaceae bacterium]
MLNKEVKRIDISNTPELLRLVEEVRQSNQRTILTKGDEEMLEVLPVKPAWRRRAKSGVLTKDAPLSQLVGALPSKEPTDASKKHEYLAQPHEAV